MSFWTPQEPTAQNSVIPHSWWRGDSLAYNDAGTTLATNGQSVQQWTSKTASAKTLSQATSGNRPLLQTNVIDGHSVLRFDGTNDLLQASTASDWTFLHNATGHTLFVVWKKRQGNADRYDPLIDTSAASTSNTGYHIGADNRSSVPRTQQATMIISKSTGGTPSVQLTTGTYAAIGDPAWHVSCTSGSTIYSFYLDGRAGELNTGTLSSPSASSPTYALTAGGLGSAASLWLDGDIAEIIIYNSTLTTVDRQQVFQYLRDRYPSLAYADTKDQTATVILNTYDSNDHNGFPVLIKVSDSKLLVVFRRGTTHDQAGVGKISYCRSLWGGASGTWENPVDILTPAGGKNWQEVTGLRLASGRILLAVTRTPDVSATNSLEDDWTLYSDDEGTTWSTPVQITASTFTGDFTRIGTLFQSFNGDVFLPIYGMDTGDTNWSVRLLKSTDQGGTWTQIGEIADGQTDGRSYSETSLAYYGATLVAIVRLSTTGWWRFTSSDNGATWSSATSVATWIGGRPFITKDAAGHFYSVIRDGTSDVTRLACSVDGGATWQRGDDFGTAYRNNYGNCIHMDNGIGFVYGQEAAGLGSCSITYILPALSEKYRAGGPFSQMRVIQTTSRRR